jgi:hypothetical protein
LLDGREEHSLGLLQRATARRWMRPRAWREAGRATS